MLIFIYTKKMVYEIDNTKDRFTLSWGAKVYIWSNWSSLIPMWAVETFTVENNSETVEKELITGKISSVKDVDLVTITIGLVSQNPEILGILFAWLVKQDTTSAWLQTWLIDTFTSGKWSYETWSTQKHKMLSYSNADMTPVTITSVVSSVDWTLAVGDDYIVTANATWSSVIEFVSWWALTTLDQTITVTYNATTSWCTYTRSEKWCVNQQEFVLEIWIEAKNCTLGTSCKFVTRYDWCKANLALINDYLKSWELGQTREITVTWYFKEEQFCC